MKSKNSKTLQRILLNGNLKKFACEPMLDEELEKARGGSFGNWVGHLVSALGAFALIAYIGCVHLSTKESSNALPDGLTVFKQRTLKREIKEDQLSPLDNYTITTIGKFLDPCSLEKLSLTSKRLHKKINYLQDKGAFIKPSTFLEGGRITNCYDNPKQVGTFRNSCRITSHYATPKQVLNSVSKDKTFYQNGATIIRINLFQVQHAEGTSYFGVSGYSTGHRILIECFWEKN